MPMKTTLLVSLLGLLAFSPALLADPGIERVVDKVFTVQPDGELKVETWGGDIKVVTSSDNTVSVRAVQKFRTTSESEADKVLENLDLVIEQSGNDVSASARYTKSGFGWISNTPVKVDFYVKIPMNYNVTLKTSGGDVDVADLSGKVDASTSGGDVELGRIAGEVRVRTSGGDIEIEGVTGVASLSTSGGDIKIRNAADTVTAKTSGGDIEVAFTGALTGSNSLSTSGGEVEVKVGKTVAFKLDASTSGGRVEAAGLAIVIEQGGLKKNKLSGAVNGGGEANLKLRSSGGDIEIMVMP